MNSVQEKYLKYKQKYLELKKLVQYGGEATLDDTVVSINNDNYVWGIIKDENEKGTHWILNNGSEIYKRDEGKLWKIRRNVISAAASYVEPGSPIAPMASSGNAVAASQASNRADRDAPGAMSSKDFDDLKKTAKMHNTEMNEVKNQKLRQHKFTHSILKITWLTNGKIKIVSAINSNDGFDVALQGEDPKDRDILIYELLGLSIINESILILASN